MTANGYFVQLAFLDPVVTGHSEVFHSTTEEKFSPPKPHGRKHCSLSLLLIGLVMILAHSAHSQAFTTLHDFRGGENAGSPYAELLLVDNTFYGTASGQGSGGFGTVFAVNADGSDFRVLHHFNGGADGSIPQSGLVLAGDTLYGTARLGGAGGNGTVFAIKTNGTGFTVLHSFADSFCSDCPNTDGAYPVGSLSLSGETLYGTAEFGGENSNGTVFRINTNGTGFMTLHHFSALAGANGANSDGAMPRAGLVVSGDTLYGAAYGGGTAGNGALFKVNTDGTGFTTLFNFTPHADSSWTNSSGIYPYARLLLAGDTLYGTTFAGGNSGNGTVFKVDTNGTSFTVVYHFSASGSDFINSDGNSSSAPLILFNEVLYGTATMGGSSGYGTVFKVQTDGTGFSTLHHFTATSGIRFTNSDGAYPNGGLVLSGSTLYGTANGGGGSGYGTVFSVTLDSLGSPNPPRLTITRSGADVILSWPTNAVGFDLFSSASLPSTLWDPVADAPVVVGNEFRVTSSAAPPQRFYRLQSGIR